MSPAEVTHQIASRCVSQYVRECTAAELPWTDVLIGCETMIVVAALTAAAMANPPDPSRWMQEMIELMTERAHLRAQENAGSISS